MDLSDLRPGAAKPQTAFAADLGPDDAFRELVGQLGREVATPLASALERVNAFATSGRIDRSGLRALRDEIERARRIGLSAQQMSRFASGRVRQSPQRLNLTQRLRDALSQRQREIASRGIELRPVLEPAEIIIDAPMCSALLEAVLDWSFEHAHSHIDFCVDLKPAPVQARLVCRFAYVPPDALTNAAHVITSEPLNTIGWQLLRRLAQTLGLVLQREESAGNTQLVLEFAHTVVDGTNVLAALELDATAAAGPSSQPMVGRHVLVIASRRDTRNSLRDALRPMGLMVDYVNSVDEARQFCTSGMPHAIVYEAALAGENFRKLRTTWNGELPTLAFIEIAEQGRELLVNDQGGQRTSRIGRDVIASALPGALMFELAQAG